MGRLEFRGQLTQDHLRRWRKLNRPSRYPRAVMAIVLLLALVYLLRWVPTAQIEGREFKGRSVIVMVDRSGSMGGTESILAAQLDQLKAAGISVDNPYVTRGFGLSPSGAEDNLLYPLRKALEQNLDADTIYVFSDFSNDPEWSVDGSDEAGYQELREKLSERRMRLYLGTVNYEPSNDFASIARESGGDVIHCK
jgi:hypothetical protein